MRHAVEAARIVVVVKFEDRWRFGALLGKAERSDESAGQGLAWHPVGDAKEIHTGGAEVPSKVHHVGTGAETRTSDQGNGRGGERYK